MSVNPRVLSHLLTESGRLRPPEEVHDPETQSQLEVLRNVQTALDDWEHEDRDASEDFSDEVAILLDDAWGEDPTPRTGHYRRPSQSLPPERPETPLDESWRDDLAAALDRIENAPVSPEQRKILSRDPGQAEVNEQLRRGPIPQHDRGTQILKRGDAAGAILEFSKAIRANPGHPQPWTKRGIAKARRGDLEGAVDDYSEALDGNPDYLPALANRAAAYFHLDDFEATEADCSRTLELAPKLAKAWLFRGIARAKLGWGQGAQEDLLQFLTLSPYSPYVTLIRHTLKDVANWDEDDEE